MTPSESGWLSKQLCLWGLGGTEDKWGFQPERTQAVPQDMPLNRGGVAGHWDSWPHKGVVAGLKALETH